MKWVHFERQGIWRARLWIIIKTGKRSYLLKNSRLYPKNKAQSYNSLEAAQLAAELQEGGEYDYVRRG